MNFFARRIYPMEPRSSPVLPQGDSYRYQVKWDGMRLLAFGCKGRLRLQGRSLQDKTLKYPELSALPQLVRAGQFILDGELIALTGGRPCFYSLMRREQRGNPAFALDLLPLCYMVFDCLYLEGRWLLEEPWEERQELLCRILQQNDRVRLCANYPDGENLLSAVKKQNLEGVVSKKRDGPYLPGPRKSSCWLKTKLKQQIEALVGGLLLKNKKAVSLLLGLAEGAEKAGGKPGALRYIGKVSSGLTAQDLAAWQKWGSRHELKAPPFQPPLDAPAGEVVWVAPLCRVNVTFDEWTPHLKLRAPRLEPGGGDTCGGRFPEF